MTACSVVHVGHETPHPRSGWTRALWWRCSCGEESHSLFRDELDLNRSHAAHVLDPTAKHD